MTTTIEEARTILANHNFYWMMSEDYRAAEREAESDMRYFLKTISVLDAETQKTLRAEWMERYNQAHNNIKIVI